jgi:hypothetical protein
MPTHTVFFKDKQNQNQNWYEEYTPEISSYASAGFLLGLLFGPKDGDMLLQNISLSLNDMTLQPTIPRSSQSLL